MRKNGAQQAQKQPMMMARVLAALVSRRRRLLDAWSGGGEAQGVETRHGAEPWQGVEGDQGAEPGKEVEPG